jgi:hypothetical protein
MWDYILKNLPWLLPLCLPVTFLIANALIKMELGVLNAHLLGADTALCGCSLFAGTLLRQISTAKLTDAAQVTTAILVLVIFFVGWVICLLLGRSRTTWKSSIAMATGSLIMYLSVVYTWRIL